MDQTASRNELEKKLYRSFTLLSALIIVLSLGITLYFDITRQRADMDATISGTASYIASMPQVVSMLEAGYPSALAKQDIDSLCNNLPDISVVVICDSNSLRFYHTDRLKTGETFVDGTRPGFFRGASLISQPATEPKAHRGVHSMRSKAVTELSSVLSWPLSSPPIYRQGTVTY